MEAYKHKRKMTGDVFTLNVIAYVFCGLVALLCLIPFIIIISSSFSSEEAVLQNGFSLLPQDFSLQAYETVFREPVVVFRAYATTILLTLCGTVLGLLLQTMTAYVLARKTFTWRRAFSFFFYFSWLPPSASSKALSISLINSRALRNCCFSFLSTHVTVPCQVAF